MPGNDDVDSYCEQMKRMLQTDLEAYNKIRMLGVTEPFNLWCRMDVNPPMVVGVEWKKVKNENNSNGTRYMADVYLPEYALELTWDESEPYTLYWAEFRMTKSGKKKYGNSGCDDLDDIEDVLGLEVQGYDDIAEEDEDAAERSKAVFGLDALADRI